MSINITTTVSISIKDIEDLFLEIILFSEGQQDDKLFQKCLNEAAHRFDLSLETLQEKIDSGELANPINVRNENPQAIARRFCNQDISLEKFYQKARRNEETDASSTFEFIRELLRESLRDMVSNLSDKVEDVNEYFDERARQNTLVENLIDEAMTYEAQTY
ncbi:hypothetical protein KDA11_01830 [Candidatus Saccharibacteria bacterium]|nr:hypothetical protein [Candidatus Saccharibacteria bacterium]